MIQETKRFLEQVKAKNMASDKRCTKCRSYIANFKDDFTIKHFGYGEVKVRPSCRIKPYAYVSHNPAAYCSLYKEKGNENKN